MKEGKLKISPTPSWYTIQLDPQDAPKSTKKQPSSNTHSELYSKASKLHVAELESYTESNASTLTNSSADSSFLQRVLSSGTLSDRLSALTLMVQSSPLHNTKALENLRNMSQKKSRDESLSALRAIIDWWVGGGAPNRKLKSFHDQQLETSQPSDSHLILWYFEDWLKKYFFTVLQTLESLTLDPLQYVRLQAMGFAFTLLSEKPEQEHNLLRLIVRKLGDSEKAVASRASYHLLQLLQKHQQMKLVVIREIKASVLRPLASNKSLPGKDNHAESGGRSPDLQMIHARYYGMITINQIVLSRTTLDQTAAASLVDTYFELFRELLSENDSTATVEPNSPSKPGKKPKSEKYRQKKSSEKSKGDSDSHGTGFVEVEDTNSRLISAVLTGINRAIPFVQTEDVLEKFTHHIDKLFAIMHTSNFNVSIRALGLILHISSSLSAHSNSAADAISARFYRALYTTLHDARLASSSKQAMFLNLVFTALKKDSNLDRAVAIIRRFIQYLTTSTGAVEFVIGGLYLLGELRKSRKDMRSLFDSQPSASSSDPEHMKYEAKVREPQYAHASASCIWEIGPLLKHYHPAVRLLASQLLQGKPLTADADLSQNTLSLFLDRFIYKKPKKTNRRGTSAMQPAAAALDSEHVRILRSDKPVEDAVNESSFWQKNPDQVPVDQKFFLAYFKRKDEQHKLKSEKADKRKTTRSGQDEASDASSHQGDNAEEGDSDKSDVDEDEDEDQIWKAMKNSMPDRKEALDDLDLGDSELGTDIDPEDPLEEDMSDAGSEGFSFDEDPDDLIEFDGDEGGSEEENKEEEEEEEWGGVEEPAKKRKINTDKAQGRKRQRTLPTFATYDDYARMIEDGPEDSI